MAGITPRGSITISTLRARVAGLGEPPFRAKMSQVLAAAAGKLVADTFAKQQNPYGKAWQPLQYRRGQALRLTGRLKASVATVPLPNGFRIDATAEYGRFHQYGTKPGSRAARVAKQSASGRFVGKKKAGNLVTIREHAHAGIPQRQFIPMPETGGLPDSWRAVFDRDTADLVTRQLRGAA